jgi:hypothetical protein
MDFSNSSEGAAFQLGVYLLKAENDDFVETSKRIAYKFVEAHNTRNIVPGGALGNETLPVTTSDIADKVRANTIIEWTHPGKCKC